MAKREELLKFKIETEGDRELAALASKLLELGDGSDTAAAQATQLVGELQRLSEVTGNIRSFVALKASLTDTGSALDAAKTKLAAVRAEFDAAEKPTTKLEKALARAGSEVEKLTKQQNRQSAELGKTSNALKSAGVDTEKLGNSYADLQQELSDVGASAQQMTTGLDKAGAATKGAASGVSTLDRAASASSTSLASIATRLTLVSGAATAAIKSLAAISGAALFTGAIQSASTLEEALSQVQAVSGASAAEMVKLKDAAEAGGAATKFSTLEAAQGLGELARATGSATTAIAALPSTLALAQAAGIGVADAATLMTTTLTQFGLGADQAARVADVMAKEVNSTTDSMSGLGNALSYAAPLAKQLGLDVEDTAAIIGVLADEGFRGERAGTALRNVFTEMSDPASSFARELRNLGIETSDFAEVITQLAAKGDRGKAALLELDAAARPAITALVDKGGAKLAELEASLRSASGEAERTAATMGENLAGAAESMRDSFDRTRRALVEPILAPLQGELRTLAAELEAFAASPEFEQIKIGLQTVFVDAAAAARQLITEIDFQQVATNISTFLAESSGSITSFTEHLGEVVATVQVVANSFQLLFNSVQAAILLIASMVSGLVSALAQIADAATGPTRAVAEFLGLIEEGAGDLSGFAGGMGAVSDEFRDRFAVNVREAGDAIADMQDNVASASQETERSATRLQAAGNTAAAAGKQMGDAGKEAASGMAAGAKGTAEAAAATQTAAATLEGSAGRIKKAYADLGIESQENLRAAAEAARVSFNLIRDAVRSGEASAEDARRAFVAYAAAARAAVADSDLVAQQRVESELRVQQALVGTRVALVGVGEESLAVGQKAAAGAGQAGAAFTSMGSSARSAASDVAKVGDAAESAGDGAKSAKPDLQSFSLGLGNISQAAKDALLATNKIQLMFKGMTSGGFGHHWTDAVNNITRAIRQQQAAVDGLIASLNQQNAAYDENAQRLIELRRQYSYLADEELQRLIEAENELRDNRAAADEEARQASAERTAEYQAQAAAAAEAAQAAAESGSVLTRRSNQGAQATAAAATQVLASASSAAGAISAAAKTLGSAEVVLRVIAEPNQSGQAVVLSTQQMNDIASAVVRMLSLSKGSST